MKIRCVWRINLPFEFMKEDGFEFDYVKINDIYIKPIESKPSIYGQIEIYLDTYLPEQFIPFDMYKNIHEKIEYKEKLNKRIGPLVNNFIDKLSNIVNKLPIVQVFNGKGFTTKCSLIILDENGNAIDALYSGTSFRVVTKKKYEKLKIDAIDNQEKIEEQFLKFSNIFLQQGYLDMSIMNLSMALESKVKKLVYINGITPKDLLPEKGYLEKFFHRGLKLVLGTSFKESEPEVFEELVFTNDIRDHVAHGNSVITFNPFKGLTKEEIFEQIQGCIYMVDFIFSWIDKKILDINL